MLRVGASTLCDWKRDYPEFAKALDVEKCLGAQAPENLTKPDIRTPSDESRQKPGNTSRLPQEACLRH